MYYLSVLAIFKNETMNLKMWIDHYLWQGVEHFYLIDNGSTDKPLAILKEYIDNSEIKDCLNAGSKLASKIIQKIGARL